jgi:hypothetical protein
VASMIFAENGLARMPSAPYCIVLKEGPLDNTQRHGSESMSGPAGAATGAEGETRQGKRVQGNARQEPYARRRGDRPGDATPPWTRPAPHAPKPTMLSSARR